MKTTSQKTKKKQLPEPQSQIKYTAQKTLKYFKISKDTYFYLKEVESCKTDKIL